MQRELNVRNAFRPECVPDAGNALLTEYYLLFYTILYYISVPERVPPGTRYLHPERVTNVALNGNVRLRD